MESQVWIDGLVQETRNSIANALELPLSGTNPSKCTLNSAFIDAFISSVSLWQDFI